MTKRWRRTWPERTLASYPLTQTADTCQRCGLVDVDGMELDHIVELAEGGLDHPYNLVRLCWGCHRAKPLIGGLATQVERRLAILTWIFARPAASWSDVEITTARAHRRWSESRRPQERTARLATVHRELPGDRLLLAFIDLARSAIANDAAASEARP